MKKKLYGAISALLTAALLLALASPAFAARQVTDPAEKARFVSLFNDDVNAIKTELPYAVLTYENRVPEHGISAASDGNYEALDKNAERFLIPVLEGLFNNNSNLSQAFIKALFGERVNPETVKVLNKGTLRDLRVPLYGEKIVSALTPAEDFSVDVETEPGGDAPTEIELRFRDMPLEEARNGSIGKVFSLPSGAIDPVLIGSRNTGDTAFYANVKFQDFYISNAVATARYNGDGMLTSYETSVDYLFAFTFYDVMTLVSAFLGYNFYATVLNAINLIFANLDRDGVSAEDLLRDHQLNIVYRCVVRLDRINWDARYFGDADGDGAVTAADARAVLRSAVDLERIADAADIVMCDMDFDGEITAADARLALRTAVGLDKPFSEVPEGKEITIADIDAITAKPEGAAPITPEPAPDTPIPGTESDPALSALIQGIFDIIHLSEEIRDIAHGDEDEFV